MTTKNIKKMKKSQENRPGELIVTARWYYKLLIFVFTTGVVTAVALQVFEVGAPGMAWFVYQ